MTKQSLVGLSAATVLLACITVVTAAEVLPERGAAGSTPATRWEEAFATGNGRMGAMLLGNPENDTLIANHCRLFLPLGSYETVPDLAAHLGELRRIIRRDGTNAAMTFLMEKAAEQGFPGIIFTDPFHPGLFVHVRQPAEGDVHDYLRTEDFRTGEVAVQWQDDRGGFRRRLFVSRPHNVIAFAMTSEHEGQLTCDLEFPIPKAIEKTPIGDKGWRAGIGSDLLFPKRTMSTDLVTFHNTYTRGKGGFDVATRIIVDGGHAQIVDDRVRLTGANEVLLLVRIVPWKIPLPRQASDAWAYSAENPDFTDRLGRFEPVPALSASSVVPYRTAEDAAALRPQLVRSLQTLPTDYDALFVPHRKQHAELFDRVSIDLGGGEDRAKTSEELIAVAGRENRLPAALAETVEFKIRVPLRASHP